MNVQVIQHEMPRALHGQIRMLALQRLHASQFIHADRAFALFGTLGCPGIDLTALNDFLFPLLVGNFCQPISEAVRSEQLAVPFFEQIGGMPWRNLLGHRLWPSVRLRFLSLSDFLIGRLAFAGASHAIAAI